jgi:hypothetical protein
MFEEHQYRNSLKEHFKNTDVACPLLEQNVTRRDGKKWKEEEGKFFEARRKTSGEIIAEQFVGEEFSVADGFRYMKKKYLISTLNNAHK